VAGTLLMFCGGLIMTGTLALLPTMLQNLMNYPALTTGMVTMPRGIGSLAAMFLVAPLINRVDNRLIILFGLLLTAVSMWQMSQFSLQMGMTPVIISGEQRPADAAADMARLDEQLVQVQRARRIAGARARRYRQFARRAPVAIPPTSPAVISSPIRAKSGSRRRSPGSGFYLFTVSATAWCGSVRRPQTRCPAVCCRSISSGSVPG
jgi:hypothetical protein